MKVASQGEKGDPEMPSLGTTRISLSCTLSRREGRISIECNQVRLPAPGRSPRVVSISPMTAEEAV
jgi:hypothetical protein